jgi:hypothetical protein
MLAAACFMRFFSDELFHGGMAANRLTARKNLPLLPF